MTYRRDGGVHHGELMAGDLVAEWGDGDLAAVLGDQTVTAPATDRGRFALADVQPLAPILRPGKVFAVAANYQEHITESGGSRLDKSTLAPRLFLKPVTAVVGTGAEITRPPETTQLDWEAELVVVIGRSASRVPVASALGHVVGYAVGNDISARSVDYGYPREVGTPGASAIWFFDWLVGKSFDGFAPCGPLLVTADEVPDPQNLPITLDVNGRRRQDGNTSQMIFTVAELVSFASRVTTLEPGDLIFTGTPSGVGSASGDYLVPGDVMEVRIGDLGVLVNSVR
jgi:2-keto-4-pentenoate hydratase/2-oxohepta-3-ene-1,7-dioic acid hydratase in catechol pathway